MNQMNPSVDGFLRKAKQWKAEMAALRMIVLDCQLTEEMKWRIPVYTLEGSNLIAISGLKEYCVLSFFKGALLKDPHGILLLPGENTQSARVVKFTSVEQITDLEPVLKAYIQEAIAAEKAGLKVQFKEISEFAVPEEFQQRLDGDPALKTAFEALTPGRRRFYLMHFSAPKQVKTRESRIEKCIPKIFEGKGLND